MYKQYRFRQHVFALPTTLGQVVYLLPECVCQGPYLLSGVLVYRDISLKHGKDENKP